MSTGGRASTRKRDGLQFDHGCQFMRVLMPADADSDATRDFADQMQLWQLEGEAREEELETSCCISPFCNSVAPKFNIDALPAGAISELDSSRLGLLEGPTGYFTPRTALQQQQTAADGFCRLLAPGDIFVGTPSMDALCSRAGGRARRPPEARLEHEGVDAASKAHRMHVCLSC